MKKVETALHLTYPFAQNALRLRMDTPRWAALPSTWLACLQDRGRMYTKISFDTERAS